MDLVFPRLTSYQEEVYNWLGDPFETGKIAVIKSVRQSGKTFLLQIELLKMAFAHKCTSIVFEPTVPLARKVYKSIYKALEETGLIKNANSQLLEIEFTNGSEILFKSTEQLNRGLTVTGLLILDECAYLDDEAIYSILPLVNAHHSPILICSSPFTMDGYYYDMYLQGLNQNEKIRTFDWSKNPEIERFLTKEQKELYRQTMSKAKFTTEVLGEFLTSDGLLFQHLQECIKDVSLKEGDILYCGIDFGAGSDDDYTVLSVFNNQGEMVKMYRTNHLSPMQQVDWLCGLIEELNQGHTIKSILCEQNSIGQVYIDAMKRKLPNGVTLTNWVTSNKSKQDLVSVFQISLENEMVSVLDSPILLNELKKYQAEINPKTKTITYNGYKCNDDTVMATMLAYWAYKKHFGKASISFA